MKTEKTKPVTASRIEAMPEGLTIYVGRRKITRTWEQCSPRLARATQAQRLRAELSPGGYGIHWPEIDEDLSVSGLVRTAKAG